MQARRSNSGVRPKDHPLSKLRREEHGGPGPNALPPNDLPFPTTLGDINKLTSTELDALSAFYGLPFHGACLAARQTEFHHFIGW
jgi:hypothetical protein